MEIIKLLNCERVTKINHGKHTIICIWHDPPKIKYKFIIININK